jgi:hypothetical protein
MDIRKFSFCLHRAHYTPCYSRMCRLDTHLTH